MARTPPRCPHCDLRVLFEADGTCPACGRPRDAPITAEDLERIERERAEAARRAEEEPFRRPEAPSEDDQAPWVLAFLTFGFTPLLGVAALVVLALALLTTCMGWVGDTIGVFSKLFG